MKRNINGENQMTLGGILLDPVSFFLSFFLSFAQSSLFQEYQKQ
jgi:hypothetical protein